MASLASFDDLRRSLTHIMLIDQVYDTSMCGCALSAESSSVCPFPSCIVPQLSSTVYHGPRPQRSSLAHLLTTIHAFLSSHPTETLLLCLKEEIPPGTTNPNFSKLVYAHFEPFFEKYWFLENRIPTLGEVRGKGMVLTRFDSTGDDGWEKVGMGVRGSWPDSRREGFTWDSGGTEVRIQDW